MEIILYRGNMATVFFSRDSAEAAIKTGAYRRSSLNAAVSQASTSPESPSTDTNTNAIDVNSAPLTKLQSISGIGIARAREIIESRPYQVAEDLIEVTEAVDWLQLEQDGIIRIS